MSVSRRRMLAFALSAPVAGCANLDRLPAVPAATPKRITTSFAGIPGVRFVPGEDSALVREAWIAQERRFMAAHGVRPQHMLALSGGGENGAFGAGLLYGWSQRGDRPEFEYVTGVSTGALIAPLAFLGARYDETLKAVYTTISVEDVARPRPIAGLLSGDALADTTPLAGLIERSLSDAMVAEIAREHRRGRVLLVATTNLDAARPVVWNIGAIADSAHAEAPKIIRRILLASAAIPGAFPPVMFDVDVDGQRRQEMHVDGGATAQFFLYPTDIPLRAAPPDLRARRRVAWVIRNGRVSETPEQTARGLLPIAQRSISTLITANSMGDIYRTYLTLVRDGISFNLAVIGADFSHAATAPFDRAYMNALFEHGRRKMVDGSPWLSAPPGFAR